MHVNHIFYGHEKPAGNLERITIDGEFGMNEAGHYASGCLVYDK